MIPGAVITLIMLVIGTIGNVMSLLVLRRTAFRNVVSSIYLRCLTIIDLLILYTGLLRKIIFFLVGIDIRWYFLEICGVHYWLTYSFLHCSAWVRIAFTIQRISSVWLPHGSRFRFNHRTARINLAVLIFVILATNSHMLYGKRPEPIEENNQTILRCGFVNKEYKQFFGKYWTIVDFLLFPAIPSVLMITGNLLIILKVFKSKHNVERNASKRSDGHTNSRTSRFSSMTLVLIVLNVSFIILTAPFGIMMIGNTYFSLSENLYWILFDVFDVLTYVDNSVDFLLYCLTGSLFRQELKKMLSRTGTVHSVHSVEDHAIDRLRLNNLRISFKSRPFRT